MSPLKYLVFSIHLLLGLNSVLCLEIVSRADWGASAPTSVTQMANPVAYVVIHHSYSPAACYTKAACITAMKSMQNYHQHTQGWSDIGYNFGSGSDSRIYMGRGWTTQGAHTINYNSRSIGICLIGDWRTAVPPAAQLTAVKELIQQGVTNGHISSDYKLIGHLQAAATECPGAALYKEIETWPHWVSNPSLRAANGTIPEILLRYLSDNQMEELASA